MIRIITLIGTAFLIGIVWSDLTFDSLGWETLRSGGAIAAHDLAQIETYYVRTVAMEAGGFPLITVMMLLTILTAFWQWRLDVPRWVKLAGPVFLLPTLALFLVKTAPAAQAIAAGGISAEGMSVHAHALLSVHLASFALLTLYLTVQLLGFYSTRK